MTAAASATLDQFLLRLEDVQHQGHGQWNSKCPVPDHDDRHASLSVAAGDKGIALHCHAGCSVDDVCAAVGWQVRDLFFNVVPIDRNGPLRLPAPKPQSPADRTTNARPAKRDVSMPPATIVESWQARIAEVADRLYELKGWSLSTLQRLGVGFDGERVVFPVYDVDGWLIGLVRYRPGGQKPKTLAVGDRQLWPAPESVGVESILLVEGEPDVVSAAEIGFEAVSVPGVAKWRDEWAARFKGKLVTVCFDCDNAVPKVRTMGGREAAARVVKSLRAAGVEARSIDLNPDVSDGYDLGDAVLSAVRGGRVGDLCGYLLRLQNEAWNG